VCIKRQSTGFSKSLRVIEITPWIICIMNNTFMANHTYFKTEMYNAYYQMYKLFIFTKRHLKVPLMLIWMFIIPMACRIFLHISFNILVPITGGQAVETIDQQCQQHTFKKNMKSTYQQNIIIFLLKQLKTVISRKKWNNQTVTENDTATWLQLYCNKHGCYPSASSLRAATLLQ